MPPKDHVAYHAANRERINAARRVRYAAKPEAERARAQASVTVRRAARRDWVRNYKMEKGCIDCGYNAHDAALHLDHRDPQKKSFGIAVMLSHSWANILAEIEKCDVRCANCHAIRTFTEQHYAVRRAS